MESRLITPELAETLTKYPLYSQDSKKKDAICICVFFIGRVRWYVLEGQPEGDDFTLFTIVVGMNCIIRSIATQYFSSNSLLTTRN